jgi:YD repeat-containing protein
MMPIPGNAESVVYILAAIILAIVAAVADDFDANGWSIAFTWITAAYLISRGIAKASRVLER